MASIMPKLAKTAQDATAAFVVRTTGAAAAFAARNAGAAVIAADRASSAAADASRASRTAAAAAGDVPPDGNPYPPHPPRPRRPSAMASIMSKLAKTAQDAAAAFTARTVAAAVAGADRAASAAADAYVASRTAAAAAEDVPPDGLPAGHRRKKAKIHIQFDEKDLESDEAMWALYERWCKFYGKQRDHDEMARRFNIFKERAQLVYKANSSDVPYELALNGRSDGDNYVTMLLPKFEPPTIYDHYAKREF